MVVSFCVFSVSMLLGNILGDDISSHFQFCSSFPNEVGFYCRGDSLLRLEIKKFTSQRIEGQMSIVTKLLHVLIATCGGGHEVGF